MAAAPVSLPGWDYTRAWYHGSPRKIDILLPGSSITQDRDLARVFSHKPQVVALEDDRNFLDGGVPRLRHNGALPGFLYMIDELLGPQDIFPHPQTSMAPGLEWLTRRPLRLRLLGPVDIVTAEILSPNDIAELMGRMKSHG